VVAQGDVVIVAFRGAVASKARPAVVVSSDLYHRTRPDCIVGILTSNVRTATTPADYVLQDWAASGLHQPSAYRSYFNVVESSGLLVVGRLSERDWEAVRARLALTFGLAI
jgi:mRNA interferase MazF